YWYYLCILFFFFFQAEDGIRDFHVTGVQTCALPIFPSEELPPTTSTLPSFRRLAVCRLTPPASQGAGAQRSSVNRNRSTLRTGSPAASSPPTTSTSPFSSRVVVA